MDLDECRLRITNARYCLWVGAGVSVQLARAGGGVVADWSELAVELETAAGITPPAGAVRAELLSLPDRLDAALRKLGRDEFQKQLRERTLHALSRAVVQAATTRVNESGGALIPQEFRQLAHLGHAANPIVNFNVEDLTSRAMVAGSPFALKVFSPRLPGTIEHFGASTLTVGAEMPDKGYQRHVYHPHGAVGVAGVCVITSREYGALEGSLALQLAVHSAFESNLLIVGMSLEDTYLREQLAQFRPFIGCVMWIMGGEPTDRDAAWAYRNGIEIVRPPSWTDFWRVVEAMPGPTEISIAAQWHSVVRLAVEALRPDPMANHFERGFGEKIPDDWARLTKLRGQEMAAPGVDDTAFEDAGPLVVPILKYMFALSRSAAPAPGGE